MKNLNPKAKKYFYIITLFLFPFALFLASILIAIIAGIIAYQNPESVKFWTITLYIIFAVGYVIFAAVFSRLSWKNYLYEFTDKEFRKEYGIIFKHFVSIPYDKIQNINISQGLVTKILGLFVVSIHTAGASHTRRPEAMLPGLTRDEAEEVRNNLLNYKK